MVAWERVGKASDGALGKLTGSDRDRLGNVW